VGGLSLGVLGEAFGKRSTFVGGAAFAAAGFLILVWYRNQSVGRAAVAA